MKRLAGVGFAVVALADGFPVVGVLDLGALAWAVVGTGVAVAVAGHFWVGRQHGRVSADGCAEFTVAGGGWRDAAPLRHASSTTPRWTLGEHRVDLAARPDVAPRS